MTTLILTNDFHNSSVKVKTKITEIYGDCFEIKLSEAKSKSLKNILCGVENCGCSNQYGTRGKQSHDGKEIIFSS